MKDLPAAIATTPIILWVPVPERAVARRIAESLIAGRLAACVNILDGVESVYQWQGSIESSAEMIMVVKTMVHLREACHERILSLHPYEVPCIFDWAVGSGCQAFVEWMCGQVVAPTTGDGEHQ